MRWIPAFCLLAAAAAWSAPRVPQDDKEVLERLPGKRGDAALVELQKLRAASAGAPNDAKAASRLAQRYFELAMAEGDPRYVGYAEAALRPWPGDDASADVLFVRALLRQ